MRPGKMNRRIKLQRGTEAQNAAGEPVITWHTYATVWAEKRDANRGKEPYVSDTKQAMIDSDFIIWFRDGVTNKDRILFDSQPYDIIYKRELGYRRMLQLGASLHDD